MPRATMLPVVDSEIAQAYSDELFVSPMRSSLSSALINLRKMGLFGSFLDQDSLFRRFRDLSKHHVERIFKKDFVDEHKIARSTITGYNKKCTVRHVNLLWGWFLARCAYPDCLNNVQQANHICQKASRETSLMFQLGLDSPSWLKEIPMLSLAVFRLVVTQVGVRYEIDKIGNCSDAAYDEQCDLKTRETIHYVVRNVQKELNIAREAYTGDFFPNEGLGTKYGKELSEILELTKDVLIAMNDVIPILHVFSTISEVQKGWEIESGSDSGQEWQWAPPSATVLYHDGDHVEKNRKVESAKTVYFLMKELLGLSDSMMVNSNSSNTISRKAAQNFLNTVGATYHMLNETGRVSHIRRPEFEIIGFYAYTAKDIPHVQVRNVQFQAAVLQIWESIKASAEHKIQEIVQTMQKAAADAGESSAVHFCTFPNAGCEHALEEILFVPMFISCVCFGGGTLFNKANIIMIEHYKHDVTESKENKISGADTRPGLEQLSETDVL